MACFTATGRSRRGTWSRPRPASLIITTRLQKAGTLTEDEAKQQAIAAVKRLRYEKAEYFWINDLGKPVPKMVMHPTVPALDGKVLDEARFNKAIFLQAGS
jgi:methyl-accepting chemotaxis protein